MKIYFTASTNQKEQYDTYYKRIVKYLQFQNYQVFERVLSQYLPDISQITTDGIRKWYSEQSEYVKQCDFVVVEGSYPSTIQIGFEIGMILARGKPIILLHQKHKDPVFINEFHTTKIIKSEYDENNLEEVLGWGINEVKQLSNKRFTFFISPEIDKFLDIVANQKNTSKSEYIRRLIEKEISKEESL
jgi:hypothetical protein